jgi:spermidine synthase
MHRNDDVLYEVRTSFEHYQVIDTIYDGRRARVLFSGHRTAAQSGMARDGKSELLFDYNQRFLELVECLIPSNILLIGGGAFTFPMRVIEQFPDCSIDVVELDPMLSDIAREYFGLQDNPRLHIYHTDGLSYLRQNSNQYDLVLIDAFTHASVPESLVTAHAAKLLVQSLEDRGILACNIIATHRGPRSEPLREQYSSYKRFFPYMQLFPAGRMLSDWESQNFILVGHKQKDEPIMCMSTSEIDPPRL